MRKPIVGLAGGIGAGKSEVARIMGCLGAGVISADALNHEELQSPEVRDTLVQWWGPGILNPAGGVDRAAVRRIVAPDARARRRLEQLVHPRIARRRDELTARYAEDPAVRAVVWDIPLLFEVGLADACDAIVFVESDFPARLERVARDRGWSRGDLERFQAAQESLDSKRDRADYIVRNNSDRDALRREVADVFSRILAASRDLGRGHEDR